MRVWVANISLRPGIATICLASPMIRFQNFLHELIARHEAFCCTVPALSPLHFHDL